MTRAHVRFHRAARLEAEAAAQWYEEREDGLGSDFVAEVERGVEQIAEAPDRWPCSADDPRARRFLLARFPYSLVYLPHDGDGAVVVVAVAHGRRKPGYWRSRLDDT